MAKTTVPKQNITLSLPKTLLKQVKVLAAIQDKSLSEFLREALERRLQEASGYTKAMHRQLKLLETGFDLGTRGRISVSRDKLHERS